MTTIAQLPALKARLRSRNLQSAMYGISADPSIPIEVQQLETVVQQMELIEINRANLELLTKQAAAFGLHVPQHIISSIRSNREDIARRRAECAKRGHPVEQHPLDADAPTATPASQPPLPPHADALAVVREQLRDVEAMIRHKQYETALELVISLRRFLG